MLYCIAADRIATYVVHCTCCKMQRKENNLDSAQYVMNTQNILNCMLHATYYKYRQSSGAH